MGNDRSTKTSSSVIISSTRKNEGRKIKSGWTNVRLLSFVLNVITVVISRRKMEGSLLLVKICERGVDAWKVLITSFLWYTHRE